MATVEPIDDKEYTECMEQLKAEHNTDELLTFSEMDITDKLSKNSWLVMQYTELWQKEKNNLDKMNELKEQIIGGLYLKYKKEEPLMLKMTEFEKYYVPSSPDVMKINRLIRKQGWRVSFFASVKNALEKMTWNMKNFMEIKQKGL